MKDEIKEILEALKVDEEELELKSSVYPLELTPKEQKILLDHITNLQEEVKSANESITWWNNRFNAVQEENKKLKNKLEDEKKNYQRITTYLQEENEKLKMTNLALADDITKNKIIKQEVLTECCGIPIGEIPMLKIQNDEYKQRIDEATKELERYKNIVDEIKILSNQVKEEAKEVENEWCYQVMKKIDYLIELKGSDE